MIRKRNMSPFGRFFPASTKYLDPSPAPFMINYIVDDMDALLDRLKQEGVKIDPNRMDESYGRFAWIYDSDGNKIELWQLLPAKLLRGFHCPECPDALAIYGAFFPVVWIAFVVYWRVKAANTKTTQRREPPASRISCRALTLVIAMVLLTVPRIPLPWLYVQLWPSGFWPFWMGAALTIAGLLFAVWAREHLGRNWSHSVTIKQGHELDHHRSL